MEIIRTPNRILRDNELFEEDGTEVIASMKNWFKEHKMVEELEKYEPYITTKCFTIQKEDIWFIYFEKIVIAYHIEQHLFTLCRHDYSDAFLENIKNPKIRGHCKLTCRLC
jgi:hypothetical protein